MRVARRKKGGAMRCRHARDVRAVCAPDHSPAGWGGARVGGTLGRALRHGEKRRQVFFIEQQRSELSLRRCASLGFPHLPSFPSTRNVGLLHSCWPHAGRSPGGRCEVLGERGQRIRSRAAAALADLVACSPPLPLLSHTHSHSTHTLHSSLHLHLVWPALAAASPPVRLPPARRRAACALPRRPRVWLVWQDGGIGGQ